MIPSAAPHFKRPNIRSLFQPDEGFVLVDADLSGADAQVVFAEAGEWDTVARLRTGVKLHVETADAFFGVAFRGAAGDVKNKLTPRGHMYAVCKGGAHAASYGASGRTIALNFGLSIAEGERFKHLYTKELHPGIGDWQRRVETELRTTRSTANAFGYRVHWFDRIDGLLPEALAWGPQSTVAITTKRARNAIKRQFPWVKFLIQVHDSLVFQIPLAKIAELPVIARALEVPIPYSAAPGGNLIIPWKLAISEKSWGEAQPWTP